MEDMDGTKLLLNWYARLPYRTVDLVGDFAGDEHFMIEGDSLLLDGFSNAELDFSPGFQLLHATYIIEKFLHALYQRKANFNVVFFTDHAQLCIPPNTPSELHPRYLVAREAIIQHLRANLQAAGAAIKVFEFESYRSHEFREYLLVSGTYFVMCHDGAFSDSSKTETDDSTDDSIDGEDSSITSASDALEDSEIEEDENSDDSFLVTLKLSKHAIGFRLMINWFVSSNYNVALFSGLECRDTKAMAMIVSGAPALAQNVLQRYIKEKMSGRPGNDNVEWASDDGMDGGWNIASSEWTLEDFISFLPSKPIDDPHQVPFAQLKQNANCCPLLQHLLQALDLVRCSTLSQGDLAIVVTLAWMHQSGVLMQEDAIQARNLLLHRAILRKLSLSDRAACSNTKGTAISFLNSFTAKLYQVLASDHWKANIPCSSLRSDLADIVDGRVFSYIAGGGDISVDCAISIYSHFEDLASQLKLLCDISLETKSPTSGENIKNIRGQAKEAVLNSSFKHVLPFNHPVFDAHLAPVHLSIDGLGADPAKRTLRVFQELTHWHNHRRPINLKHSHHPKLTKKEDKRNQRLMAEMMNYACSLTNAAGGLLDPETVFVRSAKDTKPKKPDVVKAIIPNLKATADKKQSNANKKTSVKENAAAANTKKRNELIEKQVQVWIDMKAVFDKESELAARFLAVKQYINGLTSEKRSMIEIAVSAYLVNILTGIWHKRCAAGERDSSFHIAAFAWDIICKIAKTRDGVAPEIANCLTETIKRFRFPMIQPGIHPGQKVDKRAIQLSLSGSDNPHSLDISLSPAEFQLVHAAPFFDRNMGSAPDERVRDFEPDEWQRKVLDSIDANRSLFVVAPTSAGKTFISFYAMKRILEEDDDGVLVYVAPTKALVNQIAAEIQGRFSKNYKHPGKSVWAIHTRDHRINSPTACQILVTVPHVLQIMLLAPTNARSWSSRVKRIIFDEIHCIGQVDDGVIWEQLLLLAPCPIIALSATVGNPETFSQWLGMTQKANGIELETIEHRHRYSDLRKYVYQPPKTFLFNGLPDIVPLAAPGLDNATGMAFVHPVVSLVDRSRGVPDDLTLEARDCWTLWKAMTKFQNPNFVVEKSLDPSVALPDVIRKADVLCWEANLKSRLQTWVQDPKSPFNEVLTELSHPAVSPVTVNISSKNSAGLKLPDTVDSSDPLDTTLPLICSLHEQDALPALFFNYDRTACEDICNRLLTQLEKAEDHWKESSQSWKNKITAWEAWKVLKEKQSKKKSASEVKKKGKRNNDDLSPEDRVREGDSDEPSQFDSFDPTDPVNGFHFADHKKLPRSEFEEYAKELRWRSIDEWLITALRRGIGVHHAGMNRKYRQICEMLFRKKYLRVVIATGTLALGINMPCKTVVFSGDSVFLTALNFRQAAGRAGRRGFDVLGNVVFQGVPFLKVCRLLSSKLPDLNGHFPITTSLVLRLFSLLHESKTTPIAVKMVDSILSCPRIYLGGEEAKDTVLHHLRFSIEYLRRNHLLGEKGEPLNFAGCVSHLYFVENSGFAFHALLKSGYFHNLCKEIDRFPKGVLTTLMLVMAHLFGRRFLRRSTVEYFKVKSNRGTSVVVLPPLPDGAAKALRRSNKETLEIYSSYVKTFVDQHITEPDRKLPLTGIICGGDQTVNHSTAPGSPSCRYTSAFHSLSGHHDEWQSISDLCETVRSGVWLEKAVVPHLPERSELPLNAYLYDFYKHGNVRALEKYNGIRRGDMWFVLNDFSLVLATIVTSFENFLKISPATDAGMLDVRGSGDAHDDELDSAVPEHDDINSNQTNNKRLPIRQPSSAQTPAPASVTARKAKVAESWEDEADEADEPGNDDTLGTIGPGVGDKKGNKGNSKTAVHEDSVPAWDGKDYGILNVLKAFKQVQSEFNEKFKKMWA